MFLNEINSKIYTKRFLVNFHNHYYDQKLSIIQSRIILL